MPDLARKLSPCEVGHRFVGQHEIEALRLRTKRLQSGLGGGSPNDLAPAPKRWKESFGSAASLGLAANDALPRIPIQIADLAHELWKRANAAAAVELKGGAGARAIRTEELDTLRAQLRS